MEIQILDHGNEKYKGWLKPTQRHGSVYDVIPASGEALKPVGEWNVEEITANGPNIQVKLNGKLITDADLSTVRIPLSSRSIPVCSERVAGLASWGTAHTSSSAIFRSSDFKSKRVE